MYSYIWSTARCEKGASCELGDYPGLQRVPLMWREHCLECAMPLCYRSCDLYARRMDGRCLRFEKGIQPVVFDDGVCGARIEFRRWAKLQTDFVGLTVCSEPKLRRLARCWDFLAGTVRSVCDILHWYRPCQVAASLVERANTKLALSRSGTMADEFLAVVKNDSPTDLKLLIEVVDGGEIRFKDSLLLSPGWNEKTCPLTDAVRRTKPGRQVYVRAYLEGDQTGTLLFKFFDFASRGRSEAKTPAKKVKCVAWDLDNTLWTGVVGEVGADGVSVNGKATSLIKALDERGIVQTIASKNTYEIAWAKIKALGLDEYFLYPAINWGLKSNSLKEIAKALNINIDTFALIDDSAFERNEVKTALPQVRVYDATEIGQLLEREEFDVPVTEMSRKRRQTYREEVTRKEVKASWSGDYDSFLKSCEIRMSIFPPNPEADLMRCHELLNRSNQYNVSGRRYTFEELRGFLARPGVTSRAFSVADRYGDCGIVGYATMEIGQNECRLVDFVMSCRVAQKKIERAFVSWLMQTVVKDGVLSLTIKKTDRNKPLCDEFLGMGFDVVTDGTELVLRSGTSLSVDDGVIHVEERGRDE